MAADGSLTVKRLGRPPGEEQTTTISSRLAMSKFEAVCSIARAQHVSVSEWIRDAVLQRLSVNNNGRNG